MGKKGVVVAAGVLAAMTVMSGVTDAVFMALRAFQVNHGICRYRLPMVMPCGLVVVALALASQILASIAIGRCGAWRIPSEHKRGVALLLFIVSWFLAITMAILFMVGTMFAYGGYRKKFHGNVSCSIQGVGVFMAPTILFLLVVTLDIAAYGFLQKVEHHKVVVGGDPPSMSTAMSKAGAWPSPLARENQV